MGNLMYDQNDEFPDSYLSSTIMSNLDKEMEVFLDTENLSKMFNDEKENMDIFNNFDNLCLNKKDDPIENETKSIINSYLINEKESNKIQEKVHLNNNKRHDKVSLNNDDEFNDDFKIVFGCLERWK